MRMPMQERTQGLDRREVVRRLVAGRDDRLIVVAGLGNPCWDLMAAGDHALNFYDLGAMGSAVAMGLGLALARPERRTLVITGDGEMLMGLGSLATAMGPHPANLAIAVLDNEVYAETGMQPTHTANGVDLALVARAVGFPRAVLVRHEAEIDGAVEMLRRESGPLMAVFKISAAKLPLVVPPRDGAYVKERFRRALGC